MKMLFKGLEKQLEEIIWKNYMKKNRNQLENASITKKELRREFVENYENIRKEYLRTNPKMQQQYEKQKRLRVKLALTGTVVTLGAGTAFMACSTKAKEEPQNPAIETTIEDTRETNEIQVEEESTWEEQLSKEIEALKDEDDILEHTKKIIVEGYNQKNEENPIEIDDLKLIYSNKALEVKRDKLGNVTGYKELDTTSEREGIETANPRGYIFLVDDEKVAYYLQDGTEVQSNDYERANPYFKEVLSILETSRDAQNSQRWKNSENDRNIAKEKYKEAVSKFLEKQEQQKVQQKENEAERDGI